ncbi:MAG: hypothetical protein ACOY7T_06305 [Pseudomonadota bacterium]
MTYAGSTWRLGMTAALVAAFLSLCYDMAQIFEWLGWLGSAGGPNSTSTANGIAWLLVPSLLLGPAHVAMLAALHSRTEGDRKGFSLTALALGTIYAALTGMVYFVQITFVAPRLAIGDLSGIEILQFVPYRSFLFAIDLYGYSLMCASMAFAALAFNPSEKNRRIRGVLWTTGALTPALAFQMQFPWLIWVGAFWAITYPLGALALYGWFRRGAGIQGAA